MTGAIRINRPVEADDSLAFVINFFHSTSRAIEQHGGAEAHFASRFDQTFPTLRVELLEE